MLKDINEIIDGINLIDGRLVLDSRKAKFNKYCDGELLLGDAKITNLDIKNIVNIRNLTYVELSLDLIKKGGFIYKGSYLGIIKIDETVHYIDNSILDKDEDNYGVMIRLEYLLVDILCKIQGDKGQRYLIDLLGLDIDKLHYDFYTLIGDSKLLFIFDNRYQVIFSYVRSGFIRARVGVDDEYRYILCRLAGVRNYYKVIKLGYMTNIVNEILEVDSSDLEGIEMVTSDVLVLEKRGSRYYLKCDLL